MLTLDNPPVNGLGIVTRRGPVEAITQAQDDTSYRAIVITGGPKGLPGGTDIKEACPDNPRLRVLVSVTPPVATPST